MVSLSGQWYLRALSVADRPGQWLVPLVSFSGQSQWSVVSLNDQSQ